MLASFIFGEKQEFAEKQEKKNEKKVEQTRLTAKDDKKETFFLRLEDKE